MVAGVGLRLGRVLWGKGRVASGALKGGWVVGRQTKSTVRREAEGGQLGDGGRRLFRLRTGLWGNGQAGQGR